MISTRKIFFTFLTHNRMFAPEDNVVARLNVSAVAPKGIDYGRECFGEVGPGAIRIPEFRRNLDVAAHSSINRVPRTLTMS